MERIVQGGILVAVTVVSIWLIRRHPIAWATALMLWLAGQQLVGPVVWGVTRNLGWSQELILIKEFAIAGALVGVLPSIWGRLRALSPAVWLAVAYGALVLVYVPFVVAAQPIDQTLRGIRGLGMPVALLIIGYGLLRERSGFSRLATAYLAIGIAVAAFAVIERFAIQDSFWLGMDIRGYWVAVKGLTPNTISVAGLPGNFYAYFAGPGIEIRRAVGSLGDPLGLAYFLTPVLLVAVAELLSGSRERRTLCFAAALVSAVAIGLSLSRLPIIVSAAGSICLLGWGLLIQRRRPRLAPLVLAAAPVVLMLLAFSGVVAASSLSVSHPPNSAAGSGVDQYQDPSIETHLEKLTEIDWVHLALGQGPGSHGILASAYVSTGTTVSSNENVFVDIASQVGVAGALLFGGCLFLASLATLHGAGRGCPERGILVGLAWSGLGLLAAGIFSPQLLVITSLGSFWVLMGIGTRLSELVREDSAVSATMS